MSVKFEWGEARKAGEKRAEVTITAQGVYAITVDGITLGTPESAELEALGFKKFDFCVINEGASVFWNTQDREAARAMAQEIAEKYPIRVVLGETKKFVDRLEFGYRNRPDAQSRDQMQAFIEGEYRFLGLEA